MTRCCQGSFLGDWGKLQRARIHAIAKPRGHWTILENMAQMSITPAANGFYPFHTVAAIPVAFHGIGRDCLEKTGPACATVKLGRTLKQRLEAGGTEVSARRFFIVKLTGKTRFGVFFEQHIPGVVTDFFSPEDRVLNEAFDLMSGDRGGMAKARR